MVTTTETQPPTGRGELPGDWRYLGSGSRYRLRGTVPSVTVILGWDHPLQTYFAQVWEVGGAAENHEDGTLLQWLGTRWKEFPHSLRFEKALAAHALVPEDLWCELIRDRGRSIGIRE